MKAFSLAILLLVCIGLACKAGRPFNNNAQGPKANTSANSNSDNLSNSATTDPKETSCIGNRKAEDVEKTLSGLGFRFAAVGAGGTLLQASSIIDGEEVRIVLIHGKENELQTARVQTFKAMTDKKRKAIERITNLILTGIKCGDLPKDFVAKFHDGLQVGSDDRVFNGFVYLTALQNPTGSVDMDRISMDVSFEENPGF
ncbi:MAG: hypothetical protein KF756_05420 [Acidobacteria bacterium]|nr:hypothetical protein [Acidobacteriota bacterium]